MSGSLGTSCIICKEFMEYNENEVLKVMHGLPVEPKVCNSCRDAVLKIRREMEEEPDE